MCMQKSTKTHTNTDQFAYTYPPERSLGIHGDRIFWVDPLSCGGQVEPWGIGGWCSVGVLPEDGV